MHNLIVTFIPGVSLGIEIYLGDDLSPEDKFAMTIDLLIVRFTYIISKEQ